MKVVGNGGKGGVPGQGERKLEERIRNKWKRGKDEGIVEVEGNKGKDRGIGEG